MGAWHLPLFFTALWRGREQAGLLILYCIPLTVIANWLTFRARQSALPAMLLHAGTNGYGALFVMQALPAGPWALGFTGLKTVVYTLIALVLIVATRGRLGYAGDRNVGARTSRPPAPRGTEWSVRT